MIVQCEHCQTKYRIPDEKVKEKGVKVRCAKCNNTFSVFPPGEVRRSPSTPSSRPPTEATGPVKTEKKPPEPLGEEGISFPGKKGGATRPGEKKEEPPTSADSVETAGPIEDRESIPIPDEFFGGESPASPPPDTAETPQAPEDIPGKGSPRPAHERDRLPAGFPEPEKPPFQEDETFEIESTLREVPSPSPPEPGTSPQGESPFEPPSTEGALEDWGNISLDSEAEKGEGENGIGLGERSKSFPPPFTEGEGLSDLGSGEKPISRESSLSTAPLRETREGGKAGKWFFSLLLVLLLGAGSYLAYPRVMQILKPPTTETKGNTLTPAKVQVRSLARQDGKMIYTVQGEVRNNSSVSVGMIQVEAQFRNTADEIVARSSSYCGNVFEEDYLVKEDLAKIRADLKNELGQSLSNSNVRPGQAVPFLIILEDPPPTVNKVTVTISGFKETT